MPRKHFDLNTDLYRWPLVSYVGRKSELNISVTIRWMRVTKSLCFRHRPRYHQYANHCRRGYSEKGRGLVRGSYCYYTITLHYHNTHSTRKKPRIFNLVSPSTHDFTHPQSTPIPLQTTPTFPQKPYPPIPHTTPSNPGTPAYYNHVIVDTVLCIYLE